jgi:hypothetical protein
VPNIESRCNQLELGHPLRALFVCVDLGLPLQRLFEPLRIRLKRFGSVFLRHRASQLDLCPQTKQMTWASQLFSC